MFRYIALVWTSIDQAACEAANIIARRIADRAPALKPCFQNDGVRVFCSPVQTGHNVYLMDSSRGVVLGRIFKRSEDVNRDCAASEVTFDAADSERFSKSEGRSLITDYWGEYVAILVDGPTGVKRIIKDPAGALPCFRTVWQKVEIVFSCLSDCIDLKMLPFTVNWAYVEHNVGSFGYDYSLSPINEISEIHRGECLEIASSGRSTVKSYWLPTQFADPKIAIDDFSQAAAALRASVRFATRSLARSHDVILMRLSGGLDSSIISGCLKDIHPRPDVTSYTYFARNGRSDERRWARLAADFAEFEHLEMAIDPSDTRLDLLVNLRPSVTPVSAFAHFKLGEMEREISTRHPYTAVFSGDGGDSGLGSECISSAVDDFIRLRGFSRGVLKLASQVALKKNKLAWSVLGNAICRNLFGSRMKDYRDELLRGTALARSETRGLGLNSNSFPHPWFRECDEVPWHIINRLGNLIATPEFYDAYLPSSAFSPAVVSPLYSQPVVELCLRIPVFVLFHEGRDRGLARLAFEQEVPRPILQRQWKDRVPRAFEELVRRNRKFIRDLLLDGALCRHSFLHADSIDSVLSGDFHGKPVLAGELFRYVHLELWLRHFVETPVQKLAA